MKWQAMKWQAMKWQAMKWRIPVRKKVVVVGSITDAISATAVAEAGGIMEVGITPEARTTTEEDAMAEAGVATEAGAHTKAVVVTEVGAITEAEAHIRRRIPVILRAALSLPPFMCCRRGRFPLIPGWYSIRDQWDPGWYSIRGMLHPASFQIISFSKLLYAYDDFCRCCVF